MTTGGTDERIETGARVVGKDGEALGKVDYLVIDPATKHLTDIVVSTGSILGRDLVVPVDRIDRVEGGEVHLQIDKDAVTGLKDYVDINYQEPPEDWAPPAGFMYPSTGLLWPALDYGGPYTQPAKVTVNAPKGTVGLSQGMDVQSSDGHKVGVIQGLDVDPSTDDATAIIVKQGHLFGHADTRIPIDSVGEVTEESCTLKLTRDEVKALEGS